MKFFLFDQRNETQSPEAETLRGRNSQLTIDYALMPNSTGHLVLLDIIGREQANISLNASVNKVTANVPQLSSGIYIYKFMVDGLVISTGKLIKE